ncbi:aromatic amino acid ammonia-lyase [Streptomyces antibioticus]|uniref:aromatic amino acid ammonia-lyase n=1 Tax=Streptomyces antibioticus TaxID=1890 RepID=UPI00225062DA|nr:aromatic amino acid ammonia-lyase [Streptomyces antibioticus]MCX5172151.1 aromatic amino acid ammonia-lyase [Streptomyces antibioticus]
MERTPDGPGRVVLNGTTLTVGELIALADGAAVPAVAPEARDRALRSWRAAERLAATGSLYGRGTGVGAQRSVPVDPHDERAHGLRLLRSHAGGAGAPLPARQVRAMLAVRANQLLAGGSGIQPAFIDALTEALRLGVHPEVHEYGAVGTGDLTALAQTGLTLIGERPWVKGELPSAVQPAVLQGGPAPEDAPPIAPPVTPSVVPAGPAALPAPVTLRPGDALALLSSNALALGQAALAQSGLDTLLRATHVVAALSLAAVSGSAEAYAAPVHALRPYPGAARAAAEVRRHLGLDERASGPPGRRIQDPFGFRAFPQAHGCALDAADRLRETVEVEVNCPSENPVITLDGTAAYHHGGFFAAPLGLALDAANLALLQTAQLSAARLTALGDPGLTGLSAFLAVGPASSSGTMILEYTANSALAELRSCAAPASVGHAVLSRGLEEAASFAGQAARQTLRATDAYATVLACELVSAVRALRLLPAPPPVAAFAVASAALPLGTDDRPLTGDVTAATELLPVLAAL